MVTVCTLLLANFRGSTGFGVLLQARLRHAAAAAGCGGWKMNEIAEYHEWLGDYHVLL
jgi:hypothetical protein